MDIKLAFEHPEARAAALRPTGLADRISLRGYVVSTDIGAFQSERGARQRLEFNLVVEVRANDGAHSDDVDEILSYDSLTQAIHDNLASERLNLLETLAERVAAQILSHPLAERAFVRIEKLDRGPGALGVEIVRDTDHEPGVGEISPPPRPRVIYLSPDAVRAPQLTAWLDALEKDDIPSLICVSAGPDAAVCSDVAAVQRRIELLAIEQNAWVLAGRDPRCVVVESRTELEWGLRHGQISVWAPSKMVLDALDSRDISPRDTASLSLWFAREMDACDIVFVGAPHHEQVRNLTNNASTLI